MRDIFWADDPGNQAPEPDTKTVAASKIVDVAHRLMLAKAWHKKLGNPWPASLQQILARLCELAGVEETEPDPDGRKATR